MYGLRFLGIVIDENFSWYPQVKKLRTSKSVQYTYNSAVLQALLSKLLETFVVVGDFGRGRTLPLCVHWQLCVACFVVLFLKGITALAPKSKLLMVGPLGLLKRQTAFRCALWYVAYHYANRNTYVWLKLPG